MFCRYAPFERMDCRIIVTGYPAIHPRGLRTLVAYQEKIGITDLWGGGLVAGVDGLRFVVPVQTIQAAPSPRFFGYKRGITWLNAVNARFAGLGATIVTGTVRDSLHILDALLNLDAGPRPEMITTDTASYSDIVFGLFRLLGYRFSPRIAYIGGTGFWRADLPCAEPGDYGPLNAIARNKVNLSRIGTHWPDMLRIAGSLVTSRSGRMTCCGCSPATAPRPHWGRPWPSTGASRRPCTCWR